MTSSKNTSPAQGEAQCLVASEPLSEDEQIAQLIKLFNLDPVSTTPEVLRITGDTRTDYFARTSPINEMFDPTYPKPIGGRRSGRATRRYWTVEILRWRIRRAKLDSR